MSRSLLCKLPEWAYRHWHLDRPGSMHDSLLDILRPLFLDLDPVLWQGFVMHSAVKGPVLPIEAQCE